jgi:Skp family chaperone for outer membrane proteins
MPRTRLVPVLAALTLVGAVAAAPARAQEVAKVGVANPTQIFIQIREKKDLEAKVKEQTAAIGQQDQAKKQNLQQLQEARNQFKPDTQQWQEKNNEFRRAYIEYETWSRVTQQDLQNQLKLLTKTTYEKIEAAVGEVARQRGLDIVIADQRGEIGNIDALTPEGLDAKLKQRVVLFANPKVDITNDVIAYLDKNYTAPAPSGGGTTTPAPAPAGGGTTGGK